MGWDVGTAVTGLIGSAGTIFDGALQLTTGQVSREGSYRRLPASAGGTYYVSGWCYRPTTGTTALQFGLETTDDAGGTVTTTYLTIPLPAAATYVFFSGTISAPAGATKGRPILTCAGGNARFAELVVAPRIPPQKFQAYSLGPNFVNLVVTTTTTTWTIAWDQATLINSAGEPITTGPGSVTGSMANTIGGLDALDSGASWHATTWVSIFVCSDGTNFHTMAHETNTSVSLPTGYTYKARAGWLITNNAGTAFNRTTQYGDTAYYYPALQSMASGGAGNVNHPPTWSAAAVGNFVPPTAVYMLVTFGGGTGKAMVSSNNSKDNYTIPSNYPDAAVDSNQVGQTQLLLESTNIYWGNAGSAQAGLSARGWKDNL